jgi:hypothetical protein
MGSPLPKETFAEVICGERGVDFFDEESWMADARSAGSMR